jgi:hypothetical protein
LEVPVESDQDGYILPYYDSPVKGEHTSNVLFTEMLSTVTDYICILMFCYVLYLFSDGVNVTRLVSYMPVRECMNFEGANISPQSYLYCPHIIPLLHSRFLQRSNRHHSSVFRT